MAFAVAVGASAEAASVVEEASAAEAASPAVVAIPAGEASVAAVPVPAHKPAPASRTPPPSNPAPHAQKHLTRYQTEMLRAAAAAVGEEPWSTVDVEAAEAGEAVAVAAAAAVAGTGAYRGVAVGRSDLRSSLAPAGLAAEAAPGSGSS